MGEFAATSYLFSPLLLGLTAHGFCIRFGCLAQLTSPIDNGRTFRDKPYFGQNKTYRGLVATGIGTAIGFELQTFVFHGFAAVREIELIEYSWATSLVIGFVLGVAAMLSELPNSFMKRQLGIGPGRTATGLLGAFFYVLDQIDYLLGTWLVFAFVIDVTPVRIFYSAIFLFVSHQLISLLGYWLGMRKTAR